MTSRFRIVAVAGAAALMLMAAAASHASPRTVVDDRGQAIDLPGVAQRIAGISYFAADAALAFGIRPVASTFLVRGRKPEYLLNCMDAVHNLGQRAAPNLEMLVKAKPDLIVAIKRYTEANAAKLERISPYMALRLETFADSDRSILIMGAALQQRAAAEKLNADFKVAQQDYRRRASGKKQMSYLFLWGSGDAPWAFYNEHMTSAVINALGGRNVAGSNPTPAIPDNTAFEMSLEAMLARNPEIIFIYDYGSQRRFESNPIWQQLKAVQSRRVVYVKDHWIESHGPVARQLLLREAAHYLYPDVFPKPDVRGLAAAMIPHCP